MENAVSMKKQMIIYILVAYGITFLMGIFMWYGYSKDVSLYMFPNAQMLYPAAGVMLAYLLTDKKNPMLPRRFFAVYLMITVIMMVCAVSSVFYPGEITITTSIWTMYGQYIIIIGSILFWIMLLGEHKEKRMEVGLVWKNSKISWLMIILFFGLYILRLVISAALSDEMNLLVEIVGKPTTWMMLISLLINFFLVVVAFFGEEYGWRYYLQPILQKKFGKRWGVILLGIVWGLWHLPVSFFYYSPGTGLQSAVGQQITCITLGIFFAYAYMKTENIWVPVILHFLNNNLIPIVSGNYSASVIENRTTTWISLLPVLLINVVVFGEFIFAKIFRKDADVA